MAPKRAPADDIDTLTVPALKARLQELGASATGSKPDLITRLKTLTAKATPKAKAKASPKAKAEPEPPARAAGKAKAKAKAEPEPPARAAGKAKAKAAPEPPARAAAKAKAEPEPAAPPARGAAKAKTKARAAPEPAPEPAPAPARGKAKAKAATREAPAPAAEPAAKKARTEPAKSGSSQTKRSADGSPKSQTEATQSPQAMSPSPEPTISGPAEVFYEDGDFSAEYAKSNRSTCKRCNEKIEKDALRIGKSVKSDKFDGMITQWQHVNCFLEGGVLPKALNMIQGFSTLKPADQDLISAKMPKEDGDSGVDSKVQKQNKKVYEVIEQLSQLSQAQLLEMLEENGYPTKKFGDKAATPKELIADGILFGATGPCGVCGGNLLLSGEGYRCRGWVNKFLKCTFKTQEPDRSEWTMTDAASSSGNGKLGKMKLKTGKRLFAHEMRDDDDIAASQEASQSKPVFLSTVFMVHECMENKDALEQLIKSNGGSVADGVSKHSLCVIANDSLDTDEDSACELAKQQEVPGATEAFLNACIEKKTMVDMTEYLLWGEAPKLKKVEEGAKVEFVEKFGVNIDKDVGEDLLSTAHVLVEKSAKRVWMEMLTKADLVSGANSFYTLMLMESDDLSDRKYWVFRKWGRIGVSQGGTKLEEHYGSKQAAEASFKKQYLDKTGNEFGHKPKEFSVITGKFVRVELEHKALGTGKKLEAQATDDGTAGEEAKGGGDQPLGKLSKVQLEKGDKVLDQVEALLNAGADKETDAVAKAKSLADFRSLSAEFYTMIPHNFGSKKPPTINTADILGAEKALIQFYLRMGFEDMGGEEEQNFTPISGVMDLICPKTLKEAAQAVCAFKDIKSCTDKGTTMNKKKAGNPVKAMNPDLYGSILLYTSNAIYKQLNKALRDEDRTTVETYFPYLRMLFEACDRLKKQKRTLWRGIGVNLYDQYKVGSTITWWGVSSCTSDEAVAKNFMAGCGDGATFLTIDVETACDISEVSFYANEAESILLPGTQLKVLSSEKCGTKSKIHLQEVGRAVS